MTVRVIVIELMESTNVEELVMRLHTAGTTAQVQLRSRLHGITTHEADIDDMIQQAELRKTELQKTNRWPEIGSVIESKRAIVKSCVLRNSI